MEYLRAFHSLCIHVVSHRGRMTHIVLPLSFLSPCRRLPSARHDSFGSIYSSRQVCTPRCTCISLQTHPCTFEHGTSSTPTQEAPEMICARFRSYQGRGLHHAESVVTHSSTEYDGKSPRAYYSCPDKSANGAAPADTRHTI